MPGQRGFWLVRTGGGPGQPAGGASEIQSFPSGQKPPSAAWGGAVYLGPTNADAQRWVGPAAARLGVPNPTNVPTLGTSLGILGSIFGGFGSGIAAVRGAGAVLEAESRLADTQSGGAVSRAVRPNPDEQGLPRGRTRPDTKPGDTTGPTGSGAASSAAQGLKLGVAGAGLGLTGVGDFLNFISWLFHPVNWLRMVEFITGILFIYLGIRGSFRNYRSGSLYRPFIGLRRRRRLY